MSLFKKYNDNKRGSTVSGSVLPRNTLFNDTGLTQSVSKPDVNIGRAESSLFKKRQETDAKRIEKFIKSPAGQVHSAKEIGFARSNPVFLPSKKILGDNPSRIINPRKVVTNTQYAGSGVFNDKFGLINISQDDGYSKYFKKDKSKLTELYDKFSLKINTNQTSQVSSSLTSFLNVLDNTSRFLGFRVPPAVLYEYAGGPGSNNGIGLTTIYKYENLPDKQFYDIKSSLGVDEQNGNKRRLPINYERNKFWNRTGTTLNAGNLVNNKKSSKFVNITNNETIVYSPFFESQLTTVFGNNFERRPNNDEIGENFISYEGNGDINRLPNVVSRFTFTSPNSPTLSTEYKSGSLKQGISDYYTTKPIRLWENRIISRDTKLIASYRSLPTATGSLNAFYDSGSKTVADDGEDKTNKKRTDDLIDFKLEIIDLDDSDGIKSYYLYFKAFIDSFTDDFKANYDTVAYPGNPSGKLYKYQSFDRNIGLTFKVAVFSKGELPNIYRKLNRLASTTLPTITNEAVRSTITKLTVGNWCKRLPGVVSSITFQNLVENPWDIDEDVPQILTIGLSYLYSSTYENTTRTFVSSSSGIGTTLFGP